MPRLADVRLRAEVEHVRPVGRGDEVVADAVVDRRLVGQVREDDRQVVANVADVVERARRGRAHECDHVCAEADERLGEVRAHEPVRAGHEAGSVAVGGLEVLGAGRPRRVVPSLI